jgi:hypothetical protein
MKKSYFLPLLQAACFLLISFFLQNCGGSHNLPLEGEEEHSTITTIETEEQGRKKMARLEEYQTLRQLYW